jgi:hypothetical protein
VDGFSFGDSVYTVDETATATEMQGPSSTVNEVAGKQGMKSSPTKSLIVLWVIALGLYWLFGAMFRRHLA